jgi:hypothetical protein
LRRFGVQCKHFAQMGFYRPRFFNDEAAHVGKSLAFGGQVNAGCTPLALQRLDQLAQHIDQVGAAGQLAHRIDLELLGAQHQRGGRKG